MAATIRTKGLRELQAAMKRMETAIEPKDVNPILAAALQPLKVTALRLLRALTKRTPDLPEGWEHIEDALAVQEGKSSRIARAYSKVSHKKAPQAIWIEYGHRMVGHKPKGVSWKKFRENKIADTGRFVTANPFFRPALDMNRAGIRKAIAHGIQMLVRSSAMQVGFRDKGSGPDETGWIG